MRTEKEIKKMKDDWEKGKRTLPEGRGLNIGFHIALRWALGEECEEIKLGTLSKSLKCGKEGRA